MRLTLKLAAIAILAALATSTAAREPKPLFAGTDIIRLTIKGPIVGQAIAKPDAIVPGTLTVEGAATETLPITLQLRGITRRKRETCTFPPLRVEFPDKPPKGSLFQGQDKLKLVTHCRRDEDFQQHVLLEYAAYKLFSALSPISFAVRLAEIDYVDDKGKPIASRLGFFIEDVGDMARRNGVEQVKVPGPLPIEQLDPPASVRFALFQNMIGNLDMSMTRGPPGSNCCHNSRPVAATANATSGLLLIPYDFDFSGLVDAPYAVSPAQIQSAGVKVRRYRGFCAHNGELAVVAEGFRAQREQLQTILGNIPRLDAGSRGKALAYLDSFFQQIESPDRMNDTLVKTCLR